MLAVVAHRRGRRLAQVGPVAGRPRCVLTVLCTVAVLAKLGQRCSRSVLSRQRLAELPAQVAAHLGLRSCSSAFLFSASDASDADGVGRGPMVVSVACLAALAPRSPCGTPRETCRSSGRG